MIRTTQNGMGMNGMGMNADRRPLMGACAVTIIAEHGPRALTHRAVDAAMGIPQGSTSYYFRTRESLLQRQSNTSWNSRNRHSRNY